MLKRILLIIVFSLASSTASAEIIHLKNGRTVEGRIVERAGYGVVIEENGARRTYYNSEIERIEEPQREAPAALSGAADVPLPDLSEIPPHKVELALRLMEASGARASIASSFESIIKEAPEENRSRLRSVLNVDEVLKQLAPVYVQHYTEEEMKELLRFYLSPTGQKHIQMAPVIMEDSMRQTLRYFQGKISEFNQPPSQTP